MKSERMTVPEQTRPRRARSKVRTYSYKTPDGHVCVDCYECALNPNGKYSEVGLPLVPICHIVGILSMGGHRIVRRGQRGCVNGWLGKGLVARSWEEYTRQVGEEAWDRLLRKAPKGVRKNMEKYKERVIAASVAKRTGGEAPRAPQAEEDRL